MTIVLIVVAIVSVLWLWLSEMAVWTPTVLCIICVSVLFQMGHPWAILILILALLIVAAKAP